MTHLYVDFQAVARFNKTGNLSCCYRTFRRDTAYSKFDRKVDFKNKCGSKCVPFVDTVNMESVNSVLVVCSEGGNPFYNDFYNFIPTAYRQRADDIIPEENVSVLILGIDGVSRLHFRRQMPLSHKFLTTHFKGVEFFGYHKVGDDTFSNKMPVLAGLTYKEIISTCWPDVSDTFDNCSFIWKNYKKAGFVTGFGEDASWIGIFHYGKYGFSQKPTDVYLRTLNYICEKEAKYPKLNTNLCVGSKLNVEVLLDSVSKFVLRLDRKLSFGFFWENTLFQDYLKIPDHVDKLHAIFLEKFLSKGVFNRSVVIVMSDHGSGWRNVHSFSQEYTEQRLPLLIVSCPPWFHQKFPLAMGHLKKNSARLTTPFDLHETLKDFTRLSVLEDYEIIKRSKHIIDNQGKMPRGISLFLPIPEKRTCEDACIIPFWCVCQ